MCLGCVSNKVDERAFQDYFNLPFTQRMLCFNGFVLRFVEEADLCAILNYITKVRNRKHIILIYLLRVLGIDKSQRHNAEIDEVLPVNSCEALNDNHPYTKISGCDGCMFPA